MTERGISSVSSIKFSKMIQEKGKKDEKINLDHHNFNCFDRSWSMLENKKYGSTKIL